MARFGVSPTRDKPSNYRPARVSVCVLSFIPHMEGYYRHRMDVLRVCLESILQNTDGDYDLLVFDNGSCNEVVEYLRNLNQEGKIDILLLSPHNIGQIGALQVLFSAAPGEFIAYSDDDVFYYPGWLAASMELFSTYPDVGFVSGIPLRGALNKPSKPNQAFASSGTPGLSVSNSRWIPDQFEIDHARSAGRDPRQYLEQIQDVVEPLFEFNGIRAFPGSIHFQYVAPRQVLLNALPIKWLDSMMAPMAELEKGVDQQGLLRLSTADRYVRHIGNVVSEDITGVARSLGIDVKDVSISRRSRRHWLLEIPRMRPLLERIYGKLYDILNHVRY